MRSEKVRSNNGSKQHMGTAARNKLAIVIKNERAQVQLSSTACTPPFSTWLVLIFDCCYLYCIRSLRTCFGFVKGTVRTPSAPLPLLQPEGPTYRVYFHTHLLSLWACKHCKDNRTQYEAVLHSRDYHTQFKIDRLARYAAVLI